MDFPQNLIIFIEILSRHMAYWNIMLLYSKYHFPKHLKRVKISLAFEPGTKLFLFRGALRRKEIIENIGHVFTINLQKNKSFSQEPIEYRS